MPEPCPKAGRRALVATLIIDIAGEMRSPWRSCHLRSTQVLSELGWPPMTVGTSLVRFEADPVSETGRSKRLPVKLLKSRASHLDESNYLSLSS
jgi:hypothetical protein